MNQLKAIKKQRVVSLLFLFSLNVLTGCELEPEADYPTEPHPNEYYRSSEDIIMDYWAAVWEAEEAERQEEVYGDGNYWAFQSRYLDLMPSKENSEGSSMFNFLRLDLREFIINEDAESSQPSSILTYEFYLSDFSHYMVVHYDNEDNQDGNNSAEYSVQSVEEKDDGYTVQTGSGEVFDFYFHEDNQLSDADGFIYDINDHISEDALMDMFQHDPEESLLQRAIRTLSEDYLEELGPVIFSGDPADLENISLEPFYVEISRQYLFRTTHSSNEAPVERFLYVYNTETEQYRIEDIRFEDPFYLVDTIHEEEGEVPFSFRLADRLTLENERDHAYNGTHLISDETMDEIIEQAEELLE